MRTVGWYSQGTQVVDFVERGEYGRVLQARTPTSGCRLILKVERNRNGTFTYYGATGDFNLGAAGRSAIDDDGTTLTGRRSGRRGGGRLPRHEP